MSELNKEVRWAYGLPLLVEDVFQNSKYQSNLSRTNNSTNNQLARQNYSNDRITRDLFFPENSTKNQSPV